MTELSRAMATFYEQINLETFPLFFHSISPILFSVVEEGLFLKRIGKIPQRRKREKSSKMPSKASTYFLRKKFLVNVISANE